ncbi:MAG: cell wall-active antibiotics response protein [Oscillospiraceae bacterium]|nr:cell wall-active antibiotics response protein [Oscillospiraceae bacterium]
MKLKSNLNWMWGILLLLGATLLVVNQLGVFPRFDFWTIVAAVIAVVLLVGCITQKSLTTLPFAVALGYIVLRNQEIVPYVATWALLVAAGLISAGIGFLIPQKFSMKGNFVGGSFFGYDGDGNGEDEDDWDWDEASEEERSERRAKARSAGGSIDNNPAISVNFGGVDRYIHADSLETVSLACNFGGMEIYLDQAELSPKGATVYLDCKFGGIDLYVPRHWRINKQIRCTFGGADLNKKHLATLREDAPVLTVTGNVMFGGVDITYV